MLARHLCTIVIPFLPLVLGLWPIPSSITTSSSPIKLSTDFAIHVLLDDPPVDLLDAVARTRERLNTDSFQRLVIGRGSTDVDAVRSAPTLKSLSLSLGPGALVRSIANETNMPLGSKSESYSLSLNVDGPTALLTANSTLGLFRGLVTFEQLWYDFNGIKYTLNGDVSIDDQPAFVRTPYYYASSFLMRISYIALQRVFFRHISQFVLPFISFHRGY